MSAILLTQICIALLVFFALILIQGKPVFAHRSLLALFFVVYFVDNLCIVLTNRHDRLQLIPNHIWEGFLVCSWNGKLYVILFAIALLYLARSLLTKEDVGWTLHQKDGFLLPSFIVILVLAAWAYIVGICSPKGEPDVKTLLYLAIMPGLNEELIYRGYLLGILDRLMPGKLRIFAAPIGWGVVVNSFLFGLLHGFWLDQNLAIRLDIVALRNATCSGFAFAWLRENRQLGAADRRPRCTRRAFLPTADGLNILEPLGAVSTKGASLQRIVETSRVLKPQVLRWLVGLLVAWRPWGWPHMRLRQMAPPPTAALGRQRGPGEPAAARRWRDPRGTTPDYTRHLPQTW